MQNESTNWNTLIAKYLSGQSTVEERQELSNWLDEHPDHVDLYEDAQRIWYASIPSADLSNEERSDDWKAIVSQIDPASISHNESKPAMLKVLKWVAAAAVIILAIFAGGTLYQQFGIQTSNPIVVSNETEDQLQHMLPDGSIVWLKGASKISYDHQFDQRSVDLRGEAFFDVESDPTRPFTVIAGNSKTTVLGTRFNLSTDRNGKVDLYVEEGRVAFSSLSVATETTIVNLGQSSSYNVITNTVTAAKSGGENAMSWRTNELNFDHAEMNQVIYDLEKYFDTSIEVSDVGILNCDIKSNFKNPTLQEVLQTLEFSLNATIERNNQTYLITAQPCK